MRRVKAAAAALLVLAVAAEHMLVAAPGVPAPVTKVIVDTGKTMAGQPLDVPLPPLELTVSSVDMAPGTPIGVHMHIWSRYVYVERGSVEVTLLPSARIPARTQVFNAGQVIVEPIGLWHQGKAIGTQPTRLIVFDQTPPGRSNHIVPPPPPPE